MLANGPKKKQSTVDWELREQELLLLLDKHRSKDGSFDVIVPGSGGKDSIYVAHQLKHVYTECIPYRKRMYVNPSINRFY